MTAPTVVNLWNGPAPHSHGDTPDDIPSLTVFLPANPGHPTPAIIICPGGGYAGLAWDHEGVNESEWFVQRGIAAFILKYRLPVNGYRHPVPLLDAQRALRLVRNGTEEWNLDGTQIGLMGFSAGGHLASTLNTHFDEGDPAAADPIDRLSCRPDFTILVYPVISMKDGITHAGSKANLLGPDPDPADVAHLSNETQVTPQTPPPLHVPAHDDRPVPIENSRLMLAALQEAGVLSMLHEYPTGGHGFGYFPDETKNKVTGWLERSHEWLKTHGVLS
jgi:acetyl esterase/lipase